MKFICESQFRLFYRGWQKEWYYQSKKKIKRIYKTLSDSDRVFRSGNVYFISLRPTNNVGKFTISVFDEAYKYKFEIKDVTSFDFRMLRKVYSNVYYWSEEIEELFPKIPAQQAKT